MIISYIQFVQICLTFLSPFGKSKKAEEFVIQAKYIYTLIKMMTTSSTKLYVLKKIELFYSTLGTKNTFSNYRTSTQKYVFKNINDSGKDLKLTILLS